MRKAHGKSKSKSKSKSRSRSRSRFLAENRFGMTAIKEVAAAEASLGRIDGILVCALGVKAASSRRTPKNSSSELGGRYEIDFALKQRR